MPAPRKYTEETRVRAVRKYAERRRGHEEFKIETRPLVGDPLGIKASTLRNWIEAHGR